jgi:general secretion pathway protein A
VYQDHFHFNQEPFSIAPDPSFLYLSKAHREALAHLMYGFSHGGFVLITGEVGTGKTTLLRNLLKQTPSDLDVAFVLNPRLTVRELLETLCEELGVHYDPQATQTVKQYIDALNKHLLRTHQLGRSTVVIIDEAQNLSPAVLEQVRLLTNLETDEKKLMRIILVGQPELSELLARQELRQLAQRITARYHLGSLSREDCYAYVAHRLSRAGGHPQLFTSAALRRLYRLSQGTPRIINVIADRALLGAYAQGQQRVNAATVSRAAREVLGRDVNYPIWISAAAGLVALSAISWLYFQPQFSNDAPADSQPATLRSTSGTNSVAATDPAPEEISAANLASGTQIDVGDLPANAAPIPQNPPPQATTRPLPAVVADTVAAADSNAPASSSQDSASAGDGTEPAAAATAADPEAAMAPIGTPLRPPGNVYDSQRQAYAAVFKRWGVDYLNAADSIIPCDFAPSAGLLCLSQYGSWGNIKQTDLPVVLELWDEQAAPYHAALTRMENAELTLSVGGDEFRTTQRQLRDIWFGAYVVLWQTPPGYRGSIRQGDIHETVGWLRQQLSGVSATPLNSSEPNYFDSALHDAVVAFQRQEGLIIDGVVGPATWIRLSTRLRLPAPRLSS